VGSNKRGYDSKVGVVNASNVRGAEEENFNS